MGTPDPIPAPGVVRFLGKWPDLRPRPVAQSVGQSGAVGGDGLKGGGGPGGHSGFGHISLYMTHSHLKPLFSIELKLHNIPMRLSVPFLKSVRSLVFNRFFQGTS